MRILKTVLVTVAVSCASNGMASDAATSANKAKLLGVWQVGLTADVRRMEEARKPFFTRQVMAFDADGSFRLFPKCGRESADFKAKGWASLNGQWSLDATGALRMVIEQGGKRLEQAVPFHFQGDDLVIASLADGKPDVLGRYNGVLPAPCAVIKTK